MFLLQIMPCIRSLQILQLRPHNEKLKIGATCILNNYELGSEAYG